MIGTSDVYPSSGTRDGIRSEILWYDYPMARFTLLPGMGGRATVEMTATEAGAPSTEFDTCRCSQLALQLTEREFPDNADITVQPQHSIDGENWADLGSPQELELGDIMRFDITDGPIGLFRWSATFAPDSSSSSDPASSSGDSTSLDLADQEELTFTLLGTVTPVGN